MYDRFVSRCAESGFYTLFESRCKDPMKHKQHVRMSGASATSQAAAGVASAAIGKGENNREAWTWDLNCLLE